VVERLLELLARNANDASWLPIFFACLIGVPVVLFFIVTLATVFDCKRAPEIRYKVFKALIRLFSFGRGKKDSRNKNGRSR